MSTRKTAEVLRPYRKDAGELQQKLTSPKTIKAILDAHDLKFMKQFGQNFLIDENIVTKIADSAQLSDQDTVLEVGPGLGTLTRELSKQAGQVYTVEIDKKLIPVLMHTLADRENVGLINEDILKVDLSELFDGRENIKIAANLPYYISTPVIMEFLESDIPFESMTFLLQKEVGERLAAEPGSKAYGALSLAAQYYADVELLFPVPASVFMPKPKVDSVVVRLTKKKERGPEHEADKEIFMRLVKAGFANRRKTLYNSLKTNTSYSPEVLTQMFLDTGIEPGIRAEQLSAADFAQMAKSIEKQTKGE